MRHLYAVASLSFALTGPALAAGNYEDWWWDPAQSGMGWNVGQQGDTIFVAWFNYDAAGNASFLSLGGTLSGDTLSGDLTRSTGPLPGAGFDPNAVVRTTVGSATLQFTSSNSAVFSYDYDGHSGTVNLQRFSFSQNQFSGTMAFALTGTATNCKDPNDNGQSRDTGVLTAERSGDTLTLTLTSDVDSSICTFTTALSAEGSLNQGSGNFSCNDGGNGTLQLHDIRSLEDYLTLSFTATDDGISDTCLVVGRLSAVRQ